VCDITDGGRLIQVLCRYFALVGDKAKFYSDVRKYLTVLSSVELDTLVQLLRDQLTKSQAAQPVSVSDEKSESAVTLRLYLSSSFLFATNQLVGAVIWLVCIHHL